MGLSTALPDFARSCQIRAHFLIWALGSSSCPKQDEKLQSGIPPFKPAMSQAFSQLCACGRSFSDVAAFTKHGKSCQKGKKRLASALTRAKEVYQRKKRRHLASNEAESSPAYEGGGPSSAEDPTCAHPGDLERAERVIFFWTI